MIKPKLWTYLAAGGALAIALSSAALGANVTDSSADASGPTGPGHSASANLPDRASSVASAVLEALTGGANPSTVAAKDKSTAEHAANPNANANATKTDNDVSEGRVTAPGATTATKPGWGCGDTNHDHSGPPGRPGATPPPGCTK